MAYTKSGKLDRRNYNRIVNQLYEAVHQSGVTGHLYHDLGWNGIYEYLIPVIDKCLEVMSIWYDEVLTFSIKDVPGYSADMSHKIYNTQVTDMSGKVVIEGTITGFAAGTVQDPWKSYDINALFWTV